MFSEGCDVKHYFDIKLFSNWYAKNLFIKPLILF